ncbi:PAS domain S-box protein [Undibacterium sp. LX40W]|uniref:histidine kinase n=1 Tax=Undibacterium nitidum TaxID=2762298 RepID=A0A923KU92_9BURK|nr:MULTISPECIES: two-component regulator propeller domain-containing protein [Undibacterium]MBC3882449.1 PAS domain S-box protein [Undibacterium nitidum]MBC3892730.1 PAS domain S-box protein [Undibacterium sp. LX40W]
MKNLLQLFKRGVVALSLFGLVSTVACAPVFAGTTSELRFQRMSALGADQLSTLSLLQDRQGFIWIGTNNAGLYRFDGYHSEKYQSVANQATTLPHDRISALYEDSDGRIWAGTQNGLARFNPETNDFTRFILDSGPSNQRIIKAISSDGKSGLWLATWGGLQHFDTISGKFTLFAHDATRPDSLGKNDLNAIAVDKQGGVWAGTWPAGIDYLRPGSQSFQHFRVDDESAPDSKLNIVRSILLDDQDNLWMGTENGVVRWNTKSDWSTRQRLDTPSSRVNALYTDRNGVLWAATLSAGLLRWDEKQQRFTQFVKQAIDPYSLPSDDVRAILHDRGGMLWVATLTDGIALTNLNSRGFKRVIPFDADANNPRPNNSLLRVIGRGDGKLWLSSNSGVALFDPMTGEVLKQYRADKKRKGSLSNDLAYSLYQEKNGPLWVGTSVGLNRLDAAKDQFSLIQFGSIADDYINVIAPGEEGVLWLGTGDSLIRYDLGSNNFRKFTPDPKDPDSRSAKGTTVILRDKKGHLWAGAEWVGGGLDMLDVSTGKFRHFKHNPNDESSISADNVSSLYEDAKGRLWVGTINGLNQIQIAADGVVRFKRFNGSNSIGAAKVVAIESDQQGKLWLSTVDGLIRFDPETEIVDRYTVSDGLSDNFAGPSHRSAEGILYFGGTKGMTAVYPDRVSRITVPPQIAITDISVFNRSLKNGKAPQGVVLNGSVTAPKSLSISQQESVFSMEFAALHFTNPGQNRYAYRLAGFDRDWVEVDADHRNATYTNLNPGEYTFQIKATNDLGIWSDHISSLNISIPPRYWQTVWFKWLLFFAVSGLLFAIYRWRVGHLTRDQARLESLVAVRLQELVAQQQLNRDNAERMQAILQNAADAILTTDKNWVIESCNRAGLEIFAWTAEGMKGKVFTKLCVDNLSERLAQGIAAPDFIEKGHTEMEVQLMRADGSPFIAELSLSGFADAGQRKFILIVRDVTEQRRVEKLKTQFVSTVSHELRTPLTAIRGGLGLMVGGATGELPAAAAKLGQIALNNAERLARLINDLLDMQKIEANMMDFNYQTVPASQLLSDVIESNQPFAQKLGVHLALENGVADCAIRVDVDRFAQVMANLMSNACKYSPKGESVILRASHPTQSALLIEVVDHGPGIPLDFSERIFQKFSQADASDTRAKDGTGLGLAIAKEMVEKMEGKIGFYGNPLGGTIFFVEFPVQK